MWADFYKRWCNFCSCWLPKANAERESGKETNQPEATADPAPGNTEPVEGESGRAHKTIEIDDLTVIKGIGPAMKKKLTSLGVTSLAELAASDPEELATKLSGSPATRVKGWIDAAQERIARS